MSPKKRGEPWFRERSGESWEGTHLAAKQKDCCGQGRVRTPNEGLAIPQFLLGTEVKGTHHTVGNSQAYLKE